MIGQQGTTRARTLRLPRFAHLPGINSGHDESALESAKKLLLDKTEDATALDNVPWLFGLRLFNERYYWEAHEVWEQVWLHALPNSREEHLLRSLIHLTNAALKGLLAKHNAKMRLAALAIEECNAAYLRFDAPLMGVAREEVLSAAENLQSGNQDLSLNLSVQNNS